MLPVFLSCSPKTSLILLQRKLRRFNNIANGSILCLPASLCQPIINTNYSRLRASLLQSLHFYDAVSPSLSIRNTNHHFLSCYKSFHFS